MTDKELDRIACVASGKVYDAFVADEPLRFRPMIKWAAASLGFSPTDDEITEIHAIMISEI